MPEVSKARISTADLSKWKVERALAYASGYRVALTKPYGSPRLGHLGRFLRSWLHLSLYDDLRSCV